MLYDLSEVAVLLAAFHQTLERALESGIEVRWDNLVLPDPHVNLVLPGARLGRGDSRLSVASDSPVRLLTYRDVKRAYDELQHAEPTHLRFLAEEFGHPNYGERLRSERREADRYLARISELKTEIAHLRGLASNARTLVKKRPDDPANDRRARDAAAWDGKRARLSLKLAALLAESAIPRAPLTRGYWEAGRKLTGFFPREAVWR